MTDPGARVVLETLPDLEMLDISNNWQVTHNLFSAADGVTRISSRFVALGVAKTNLVPIFVEQIANRILDLTGNFGTVYHQHPLDAIAYTAKHVPLVEQPELDSSCMLRA